LAGQTVLGDSLGDENVYLRKQEPLNRHPTDQSVHYHLMVANLQPHEQTGGLLGVDLEIDTANCL